MASSSSSPSTPAFSHSWNYDVFLSFRGADTRRTFVDHLYTALEQQGINTYKDDVTLPRGESINPSLKKAIEESYIAVVIFSKSYADSSWCLDELAHIMKCRDIRGQIVMPIFYDVDPSDVRKQNCKYKDAFAKHELENKTKVESWRKALVDGSGISGWDMRNIANRHESQGINQIVAEISQKVQQVASSANKNLIGIAARMKCLKSELQTELGGVLMIGVWGCGGSGKTTLASAVYNEISREFDGCCFVDNISENSRKNGLEKLQKQILCDVLKQKQVHVHGVEEGSLMIKGRLHLKKVLIVLDDVDHHNHLNALAGSHNWFGDGSRIIITTRDEHVLNTHGVKLIHNINLLNEDESIMLFCKYAPRDNIPMEDYQQLSKKVVLYAGGLPLALTVLGSFLCDKNINEWKSALERLKEIPDTDILEKLKISFDGLKQVEKDLFLDIACFFRWEIKDEVMEIFNACGYHPLIGIEVLRQKALITISEFGEFDMHDLVQEMAHHIVRGEHLHNPEKHSRIWKNEDVLQISAMSATTKLDKIKAIRYKGYGDNQLQILPSIVANMKNLRWIEWNGDFSSDHLLSNFLQGSLCYLRLSNNLQKQLWEGYKWLPQLKTIELWWLRNLIMTPDFDGLPNLKRFMLCGSSYLEVIHPSLGRLERLVFLSIEYSERLKMFPPVTGLKKLETLQLGSCHQLLILSEIQEENMENLPHLHLHDNSESQVSSYIESSRNFFVICWRCGSSNLPGVECCLEGPSLPRNNMKPCLSNNNINHIQQLFFLKELRDLNLSYCSLGDEEMDFAVWELPNLNVLNLEGNNFSLLNFSLLRVPRLKWLDVSNCRGLVEVSQLPSSIAVVDAGCCWSLESFGDISNCKWLWKVSLFAEANNFLIDILLDCMLQGNASQDYFIHIVLSHHIPRRFAGRMFRGRAFTLRLREDWYNDFSGFLICVVFTLILFPEVNIVIKQKVGEEDSRFGLWHGSHEPVEPKLNGTTTYVGYVSFDSFRHTTFSYSAYTMISASLDNPDENKMPDRSYIGVKLVPRISKVRRHRQWTRNVATDTLEYFDEELNYEPRPFTINHDSKCSVKIKWRL